MIRRPPKSPLFPYTPLSRSRMTADEQGFVAGTGVESQDLVAVTDKMARSILAIRSEEHTSELQSLAYLVCRLLLEKKKKMENSIGMAVDAETQGAKSEDGER